MIRLPSWDIARRWHGIYAKHPTRPVFEAEPLPGVHVSPGTGGSGMTMAFGLAERFWESLMSRNPTRIRASSSTGPARPLTTAAGRRSKSSSRSSAARGRDLRGRGARPHGPARRDHLEALLALPRVAEAWRQNTAALTRSDVDRLYADFCRFKKRYSSARATSSPVLPEVIAQCQNRGIRIGATTGYTRS